MTDLQSIASPAIHSDDRAHEADHPTSEIAKFGVDQPLKLDCGIDLRSVPDRLQDLWRIQRRALQRHPDLPCADARPACRQSASADEQGRLVGDHGRSGRPLDTDRYFIICANVIGGCMGSTGPASTNPATGKAWGLDFPIVNIPDMVRAQTMLLDRLGIDMLLCVIGGSMGGMQVLQWTAAYPERVFSALPVACSTRHSAQNIAFHELGRQAVMADPDWHHGRYFERNTHPHRGLAVARMAGTSPISPTLRCIASSDGGCRIANCRPSRSTRISRSRAICVIKVVLCRAVRRQQLSLFDAGDGLFRYRRRP